MSDKKKISVLITHWNAKKIDYDFDDFEDMMTETGGYLDAQMESIQKVEIVFNERLKK